MDARRTFPTRAVSTTSSRRSHVPVSRLRRAAGRQHGLRAERHQPRRRARRRRWRRRLAAARRRQLYSPGGAEPGYIAPDPKDPDVFYAGGNNGSFLTRLNRRTGEHARGRTRIRACSRASRRARSSSAGSGRTRSSSRPSIRPCSTRRRSTCGRRRTAARSWDKISPDLTRHDPKTMGQSGGPITHDMNEPGGLRDGLRARARQEGRQHHLGRIGRRPRARHARRRQDLDERHAEGHAGVRPRQPDRRVDVRARRAPTSRSSSRCSTTSRPTSSARATSARRGRRSSTASRPTTTSTPCARIPTRRGLLYAGTQHGVYVSYDDGDNWQSLSLNLPDVPVSDSDRRGQLDRDRDARPQLLRPRRHLGRCGSHRPRDDQRGRRPLQARRRRSAAPAARRSRICCSKPAEKLTIEVLDAKGQVAQTIQGAPPAGRGGRGRGEAGGRGETAAAEAPEGEGGGGGRGRGGPPTASMAAGPQPRHVEPCYTRARRRSRA